MDMRSTLVLKLLFAVSAITLTHTRAEGQHNIEPSNSLMEVAKGIRTDRLSPRQRRVWATVERIVFAKDDSGALRHARLHSLWQWVEASGHVVQVEFRDPKSRSDYVAGEFMIEKVDPAGRTHIGVIRLCLPVIDNALVRNHPRGAEGFVRFEGLRKEERYAEILGHELAHAVWVLSDRQHARLLEDLHRDVAELDTRHLRDAGDEPALQHLRGIDFLIAEIERPAEAAEQEIWWELSGSTSQPIYGTSSGIQRTVPKHNDSNVFELFRRVRTVKRQIWETERAVARSRPFSPDFTVGQEVHPFCASPLSCLGAALSCDVVGDLYYGLHLTVSPQWRVLRGVPETPTNLSFPIQETIADFLGCGSSLVRRSYPVDNIFYKRSVDRSNWVLSH